MFRPEGVGSGQEAGAERRWWPLASGLEGAPASLQPLEAHSLELRNQGGQGLCPGCVDDRHHRLSGSTAVEGSF